MARHGFGRRLSVVMVMVLTAGFTSGALMRPPVASADYTDPNQPVSARVSDLLGRMSLDEKIGQMTQAERTALASPETRSFAH